MLTGSFTYKAAFSELKAFTPVQLGCNRDLKSDLQKSVELKYQFRIFIEELQKQEPLIQKKC